VDDQQQQRINKVAQEFTDALVAAHRTASDNTVVAQQVGARQIEYFFDAVIGNLRAQAGGTSQMARQLASQQRLAQETTRDLARVSTDNYMDLLDSVFSFYQGGAGRAGRGTGRGGRTGQERGREPDRGGQEAGHGSGKKGQ
jgi:predicted Fe-Mo cluster-binding NifX family protein